jgi:hypothetical protein
MPSAPPVPPPSIGKTPEETMNLRHGRDFSTQRVQRSVADGLGVGQRQRTLATRHSLLIGDAKLREE